MRKKMVFGLVMIFSLVVSILGGCASNSESVKQTETPQAIVQVAKAPEKITLTLGAYTVSKEALQAIIPLFQAEWKIKTGQIVEFTESYEASGTQARAIVSGLEADIAILSLEGDMEEIVKAGLITSDWRSQPNGGMITESVVAIGVREGNPDKIQDWADLAKTGVEVLIPNPKTSGGAKWDVNAIYGAGLNISKEETGTADPAKAKELLAQIYRNVKVLDKSGRASMTTFEKGIGDTIITYENELLARNLSGEVKYDIIVPKYTIEIVNPAAIIDANVDKHGVREAAEAFVDFLWTIEAQKEFASRGFRSVNSEVAKQFANQYATPQGLFNIDFLGGWSEVNKTLYGEGGIWDQITSGK